MTDANRAGGRRVGRKVAIRPLLLGPRWTGAPTADRMSIKARRQIRHTRRSHIQKTRSRFFRLTLAFRRRRTISCCRRARFSRAGFP